MKNKMKNKNEIYLDLRKLSDLKIYELKHFLHQNREYVPYFTEISNNNRYYKLHFDSNEWLAGDGCFHGKTEITFSDFVQLFEQKESDEIVTDNSATLEHAKKLLEDNGYFVFPKADEGNFPDLTGFDGVGMETYYKPSDKWYDNDKILFKYGEVFAAFTPDMDEFNVPDALRPIQKSNITLSELVEKAGGVNKLFESAGLDESKFKVIE